MASPMCRRLAGAVAAYVPVGMGLSVREAVTRARGRRRRGTRGTRGVAAIAASACPLLHCIPGLT